MSDCSVAAFIPLEERRDIVLLHIQIGALEPCQRVFEVARLLWGPPVVVTSAWHGHATAMRASILPDRPRLIVLIWKANYTHRLIEQSRAFAVHFLGSEQLPLVRAFGFDSGKERNKLAGMSYETKITGSPILTEALAYVDCRVMNSMDGGDLTCYLADVVDGARLRPGEVMTYHGWQANIPAAWKPDYEAMLAQQVSASRAYFERQHRG